MTPNVINSIGTEWVFFKAAFKKLQTSGLQANKHAPLLLVYWKILVIKYLTHETKFA